MSESRGILSFVNEEIEICDAIKYCKEWIPHRNWLLKNDLLLSDLPEEIKYQKILEEFKFDKKAKEVAACKGIQILKKQMVQIKVSSIKRVMER